MFLCEVLSALLPIAGTTQQHVTWPTCAAQSQVLHVLGCSVATDASRGIYICTRRFCQG